MPMGHLVWIKLTGILVFPFSAISLTRSRRIHTPQFNSRKRVLHICVWCGTPALREVAEFVAGQSLAYDADAVTFTMQFPR